MLRLTRPGSDEWTELKSGFPLEVVDTLRRMDSSMSLKYGSTSGTESMLIRLYSPGRTVWKTLSSVPNTGPERLWMYELMKGATVSDGEGSSTLLEVMRSGLLQAG